MTTAEFNKVLRKARTVYVWVMTSSEDGCHIRTSKAALKVAILGDGIENLDPDRCILRDDGDLYIN